MIKIFSRKKRARVNTDNERATGQASLSRSVADSTTPIAVPTRSSKFLSKFGLLVKRNMVGYAEERSKMQKEVSEKQRTEQRALWKEHLDYSGSKEKLYNYQSASSLVLKKVADVTAVSTEPSHRPSKQIALPNQNSSVDQHVSQIDKQPAGSMARQASGERNPSVTSIDFFEREEERLRQHEDDVAKKNAAALLRLISDPTAVDFEYLPSGYVRIVEDSGLHSAFSTSSRGQISTISDEKLPITPNSDDQKRMFEDILVKPLPQPNYSPITTQPASLATETHANLLDERPRLFSANLLSAPLPFQQQLFTEAAPVPMPLFPYPAVHIEQSTAAPPSHPPVASITASVSSASESSSKMHSASTLQQATSVHSKPSSDSSIRISSNLLRDSREFLDEFFAKALQLSEESLPPAPAASADLLYEKPVVEEPVLKEPRLNVLPTENVQEVEEGKAKSELRQVCSAQDLPPVHQQSSASIDFLPACNPCQRCNSTDALRFIYSQSVPVSPVQVPLSPRSIKGSVSENW